MRSQTAKQEKSATFCCSRTKKISYPDGDLSCFEAGSLRESDSIGGGERRLVREHRFQHLDSFFGESGCDFRVGGEKGGGGGALFGEEEELGVAGGLYLPQESSLKFAHTVNELACHSRLGCAVVFRELLRGETGLEHVPPHRPMDRSTGRCHFLLPLLIKSGERSDCGGSTAKLYETILELEFGVGETD